MIKFFVPACVAGLFFVSAPASAGIMPAGPAVEILPGGGWRMLQPTAIASIPASTRSWEMAGPGMQAVSKVSLAGKAGPLPVNVARVIPWGLLGNAIARSLPIVGAVAAVADLAQAIRMKQIDGDWMVDVGTEKSDLTGSVWGGSSIADSQPIRSSNPSAACSALAADWGAKVSGGSAFVVSVTVSSGYYREPGDRYICRINRSWPSGSYSVSDFFVTRTTQTYRGCPPILADAEVIEGSDGRCPTGRYDVPASVYLSQPQNIQKVPVSVLQNLVEALDSRPEDFYPPQAKLPYISSVSGPASQSSDPIVSTKTDPSGSVTTTTTINNYYYNYSGDTITYTLSKTTTTKITRPDGSVETTTETSDQPPEKTNCELYPKSVGCLELGQVPDAEIPIINKNVDISPESISLPSGCPSDLALPGGRVISYASACDAAQKMRPLVIAAGVLSALLIAVAAIRGNG